ncbi:MAG: hypothetical protein KC944_06610 [Candidatus Omnitrophica bacterium]|nr:hypothetical protein [Candidatus Omnitrophota bacterium]
MMKQRAHLSLASHTITGAILLFLLIPIVSSQAELATGSSKGSRSSLIPEYRLDSDYLTRRYRQIRGEELFVFQSQWREMTSAGNPTPGAHRSGSIEIRSQQDIDDLLGVEMVLGDLSITHVGNLDLWPLRFLRKVTGSFEIYDTEITSFVGLDSLEEVEGDFLLGKTELVVVCFGSLSCPGGPQFELRTYGNPRLREMKGLESLTRVGGDLDISNAPLLRSLLGLESLLEVGDLSIYNNSGLASLNGIENLALVNGDLGVNSNISLKDIAALSGIIEVGGEITVRYNDSLDCPPFDLPFFPVDASSDNAVDCPVSN